MQKPEALTMVDGFNKRLKEIGRIDRQRLGRVRELLAGITSKLDAWLSDPDSYVNRQTLFDFPPGKPPDTMTQDTESDIP
jgi:hypothetical protein